MNLEEKRKKKKLEYELLNKVDTLGKLKSAKDKMCGAEKATLNSSVALLSCTPRQQPRLTLTAVINM